MRVRAVAVVIDCGDVLVIRRRKQGREYAVLPGGGVEAGESAEEACLRELNEETGLRGTVRHVLDVWPNGPSRAIYFRVAVERRALTLGEPELSRISAENRYEPQWIPLKSIDLVNLVPEVAKRLLTQLEGEA